MATSTRATKSASRKTRGGKHASTRQRHTLASDRKKASQSTPKRWSHHVMETSDAMDIERDIGRQCIGNHGFAQALGDAQHAPQGLSVSIGDVDAELQY